MKNGVKTGVFLCGCGKIISERLDLAALEGRLQGLGGVAAVQCHSHYCLRPGLSQLVSTVEDRGLNRILVGACSDRIVKKKFTGALEKFGFLESQVEVVNLKDHVALVHDGSPDELTRKASALLAGGAASLELLNPVAPLRAPFEGPAVILGGGIAGFEAALELARHEMESVIVTKYRNADEVLRELPWKYPGARIGFDHLRSILEQTFSSPLVRLVAEAPVEYLGGHVGDFRLGLKQPEGAVREIGCSALILSLDREYVSRQLRDANPVGRLMDQVEFEELLGRGGSIAGSVVFWIDGPDELKLKELAIVSAWNNSRYLALHHPRTTSTILYPADIRLPLTGTDLVEARRGKIGFRPYDPAFHPTVWNDHLTFISPRNRMKNEIKWDVLVVSANPGPLAMDSHEVVRFLPVFEAGEGLKSLHLKVKPEQMPAERVIVAGSGEHPCSLDGALFQGKAAARRVLDLRGKALEKGLANLTVVAVDQDLCEGCGLCNEVCTCDAVEHIFPGEGPMPRKVDFQSCDGGGSCAAACPYQAMTVLNNSSQQFEARIKAVLSEMRERDVLGFACNWGGQGAAEMVSVKVLRYPSRLFMVTVRCLGSIDPAALSMAFLNGANYILLAGCTPAASCHYGYGIDHTWFRMLFLEKLLSLSGLDRRRISLGYVDVNEPEVFVQMVESFLDEADQLGPIERTRQQREKLLAMNATLLRPRVRWVLGVGLRRPSEIEFPDIRYSEGVLEELFSEVLEEEYLASRILGTVSEAPLSPPEIAKALGEPVKRISEVLNELSNEQRVFLTGWKDRYPFYSAATS
jgi:heterodisulfide reductase subunit A